VVRVEAGGALFPVGVDSIIGITRVKNMSHVNRLKETLKKLYERRQEVADLWKKSPTTKLVLINTGVYVPLPPLSASGNSDSSLKNF
jgi:hypothetical protein